MVNITENLRKVETLVVSREKNKSHSMHEIVSHFHALIKTMNTNEDYDINTRKDIKTLADRIKKLSEEKIAYYQATRFAFIQRFFSSLRNLFTLRTFTNSAQLGIELTKLIIIFDKQAPQASVIPPSNVPPAPPKQNNPQPTPILPSSTPTTITPVNKSVDPLPQLTNVSNNVHINPTPVSNFQAAPLIHNQGIKTILAQSSTPNPQSADNKQFSVTSNNPQLKSNQHQTQTKSDDTDDEYESESDDEADVPVPYKQVYFIGHANIEDATIQKLNKVVSHFPQIKFHTITKDNIIKDMSANAQDSLCVYLHDPLLRGESTDAANNIHPILKKLKVKVIYGGTNKTKPSEEAERQSRFDAIAKYKADFDEYANKSKAYEIKKVEIYDMRDFMGEGKDGQPNKEVLDMVFNH